MAGKKQHYVPCFLQRGFLSGDPTRPDHTWLHRRGLKKHITVRDIGMSEFFYSKPSKDGDKTLDDIITDLEGNIQSGLTTLRSAEPGAAVDGDVAAELVTHLTTRTAHVRSTFQEGAQEVLEQLFELLSNRKWIRGALGVDSPDPPQHVNDVILELLASAPAAGPPRPLLHRMLRISMRETFDEYSSELVPTLALGLDKVRAQLSKVVPEAHNNALRQPEKAAWRTEMAQLSWKVLPVDGAILPDCVTVAMEHGRGYVPLTLRESDLPDLVVLPIAHDRLLVGFKTEPPEIDIDDFNRAAAQCSHGFFIAHKEHGYEGLSDTIGERSSEVVARSVNEAVEEAKAQRLPAIALVEEAEDFADPAPASPNLSFSLNCRDFDEPSVQALSAPLMTIVRELGKVLPLTGLDGMTFAVDYPAAVESVDRGDPALGVDRSQPCAYGVPVAKCVSVVRDGVRKAHLVFQADIALALLGGDEKKGFRSLHALVNMLAQIGHTAKFEQALRSEADVAIDPLTALLHPCLTAAPRSYLSARMSAFASSEFADIYAELATSSLTLVFETAKAARLQFHLRPDVDRLLAAVLPHLSSFVTHVAEWWGHRDALLPAEVRRETTLPRHLASFGLEKWLDLYGRDLRQLHDEPGHFTKANLRALSAHVERLLWALFIFAWPEEDGRAYFFVPHLPPNPAIQ